MLGGHQQSLLRERVSVGVRWERMLLRQQLCCKLGLIVRFSAKKTADSQLQEAGVTASGNNSYAINREFSTSHLSVSNVQIKQAHQAPTCARR